MEYLPSSIADNGACEGGLVAIRRDADARAGWLILPILLVVVVVVVMLELVHHRDHTSDAPR